MCRAAFLLAFSIALLSSSLHAQSRISPEAAA